jgi:hypothetical protein
MQAEHSSLLDVTVLGDTAVSGCHRFYSSFMGDCYASSSWSVEGPFGPEVSPSDSAHQSAESPQCADAWWMAVVMACFHPIPAYRDGDRIVFVDRGRGDQLLLPCGQCVGCRLERSRQWATRCVHEAQMHDDNCFITLTYDDKHLPWDCGLHYPQFQRFMKRVRKAFGSVRFYMCGEYGENTGRPHFHACLFGLDFPDRVLHSVGGSGFPLYTSELLSALWPYGFSSVADFSFETAAYTARYVMKKVNGQLAENHYQVVDADGEIHSRSPEFCHMSLKPGIGALWFAKFGKTDVLPRDAVVINGHECSVPRYYDKLTRRVDRARFEEIKTQRELDNYDSRVHNTDSRLAAMEQVVAARVAMLKRK